MVEPADAKFREDLTAMIPHMRAFARSLARDAAAADDLTQDALLRAWQARAQYTPGTNLKAWTFMILRNLFYSEKRKSWRQQSLDPEVAEQTLVANDDPASMLKLDEVRRGLAWLPVEQREALILVGAGGLAYEEAAAVIGCKIGTVKSRVSRARAALAALVEDGVAADEVRPSAAMQSIQTQLADLRSGG